MGYNGAAIASVISELIVNVSMLKYSLQEVRPRLSIRFAVSVACGSAAMVIGVKLVQLAVIGVFVDLVSSVAVGCLVYFGVNIVLKNDVMNMVLQKLRIRRNGR
jgi:hypothetical protein